MRRRLLIAAILLVLLTPFVLLGVVLYTPSGLAPGGRAALAAGALRRPHHGSLRDALGPTAIELFELDHPRVHVVVHDIVIETSCAACCCRRYRPPRSRRVMRSSRCARPHAAEHAAAALPAAISACRCAQPSLTRVRYSTRTAWWSKPSARGGGSDDHRANAPHSRGPRRRASSVASSSTPPAV